MVNVEKWDKGCFICLPSVISHQGDQACELSKRRQNAWLAKIQSEDLKPEKCPHTCVCSDHFVTGMLLRTAHPHWVPSLKLGYDVKLCLSGERSDRSAKGAAIYKS